MSPFATVAQEPFDQQVSHTGQSVTMASATGAGLQVTSTQSIGKIGSYNAGPLLDAVAAGGNPQMPSAGGAGQQGAVQPQQQQQQQQQQLPPASGAEGSGGGLFFTVPSSEFQQTTNQLIGGQQQEPSGLQFPQFTGAFRCGTASLWRWCWWGRLWREREVAIGLEGPCPSRERGIAARGALGSCFAVPLLLLEAVACCWSFPVLVLCAVL